MPIAAIVSGQTLADWIKMSTEATVASISPLLGLLGTVSGMIETFNLISYYGVGNPGTLAAGIFNIGGTSLKIIGVQLLGIGAAFLWVFPTAFLMFKLIDKTVGLRVSPEDEMEGLDLAEHGGNAYPDFEILSYGGIGSSTGGPGSHQIKGEPVGQLKPVKQT